METKKESLMPEQEAQLKNLNEAIKHRNALDMAVLVRNPAFLRYMGRWLSECGVHSAITGNESNSVFHREGRRWVGERMLSELKLFDFDAAMEAEYAMIRDEIKRRGILGTAEKFDPAQFTLEQQAFDKRVQAKD